MDALIIYPENKEQLTALKAIVKAMKISFEQKSIVYPEHVLDGVKLSLIEAEEKKLKQFSGIEDLLR